MRQTQKSPFGTGPIALRTKGDALFHEIRRAILLRELQAGETLTEPTIGREFNCSQGTVREALMRLQEEGLVQRRGYHGTIVTRSSLAEGVQMAEIRIKLEMEGGRHAIDKFSDDEFPEIEHCLLQMDRAAEADDAYALSELDRNFHLALFRHSGLTALEPILTRCMLHMHLQTFGNPRPETRPVMPTQAHRPILDALKSKDAEAAANALREHISRTIGLWSPHLKSAMEAH